MRALGTARFAASLLTILYSFCLSHGFPLSAQTVAGSGATGVLVVAELDTTQPHTTVETVFTLTETSSNYDAFALLRDRFGRWYVGKRYDATTRVSGYTRQLWDPVSPCVPISKCLKDTIYVSIQSNGQIQFDEFAVFSGADGAQTSTIGRVAYSMEDGPRPGTTKSQGAMILPCH